MPILFMSRLLMGCLSRMLCCWAQALLVAPLLLASERLPVAPAALPWWRRKLCYCQLSWLHRREHFQILCSKQLKSGLSVTIMHFNKVFSFIWKHFPQQEIFFEDWAPCAFSMSTSASLNSELASCLCLCWHNAAVNSRVGSILQLSEYQSHYLGSIGSYALHHYPLSYLKAFWRSNCSVWIVTLRLIPLNRLNLKVSKVSFMLTSRPGRSWRQWRPWCALMALHILLSLLWTAAPAASYCSSTSLSPTSSSSAAAFARGLAVS